MKGKGKGEENPNGDDQEKGPPRKHDDETESIEEKGGKSIQTAFESVARVQGCPCA